MTLTSFMLLFSPVWASDPLRDAWWNLDRGCYQEAVVGTAEALRAGADGASAHRARVSARYSLDWSERARTLADYEALHAARPDDFGLRVGLAEALARDSRPDCERVVSLLAGRAEQGPGPRYQAARVLLRAAALCPSISATTARAEVADAGEAGDGAAASFTVWFQVTTDPRSVPAEAIREAAEQWPDRGPSFAAELWKKDAKGVKASRKALLELAETWAASDDLRLVDLGARVLEEAGRDVTALRARVDAEKPCTSRRPVAAISPIRKEILAAGRRPTHELALEGLDALADRVPESGDDRVYWQQQRIERLEALGRDDEVLAALRDAVKATPDDGRLVNEYAWAAAVKGKDLEPALEALTRVLPSLDTPSWDGSGDFVQWQRSRRSSVGNWWDTHGWLLHRLGRDAEALVSLERAAASTDDGSVVAHVGIVLAALGQDDRAYAYLAAAYAGKRLPDEDVDAEARALLAPLWTARGGWHPDGFDGWIASLAPKDEPVKSTPEAVEPAKPLVGEPFPLKTAAALRGGDNVGLEDPEHILVVDLWATWCGPCVQGMPHLQEVQKAYADKGVRVVGLSVDTQQKAAVKFFQGAEVAYELGWVGQPGWKDLQLSGIPALFVVGRDGVITHRIEGYGSGDTRLERALDSLLD